MSRPDQLEDRVRAVISDTIGTDPSEITLETNIACDLGADSLDQVELVMALEEEFKLEISDEDADKLKTVGDVVRYLSERKQA